MNFPLSTCFDISIHNHSLNTLPTTGSIACVLTIVAFALRFSIISAAALVPDDSQIYQLKKRCLAESIQGSPGLLLTCLLQAKALSILYGGQQPRLQLVF